MEMTDDLKDIHQLALKRFKAIDDYERDQRKLAIEDLRFAHAEDGQWSEEWTEKRGDRPRFTFNRVIGVIKQITGEHKQNRSRIKITPDGDGASDKTADVFGGIIRKIEKYSKASNSYDNSFDEKTAGGYGGWRVLTEYQDESFDQNICIKPIVSASSSHYIDIASTEIDGSDAGHQFLITDVSEEEFKESYPDASMTDFTDTIYHADYCKGWFNEGKVRIAEYWLKTPVDKEIVLLSNGSVIDVETDGDALDELSEQGITEVKRRKVKSHKVEMYKMNGAEILEGPMEWAGKHIPLVPDYGEQITIEGKRFTRGIVRFAKDANRAFNYARSTDIEAYSLTPKDPYWLTTKMAAAHQKQLEDFPKKNQAFMLYTADPAHPGPPSRSGAPSVSAAGIEIARQSVDDIHATTSMYPPAMGNAPQLLSEKSIRTQAEKGDISSYIYQDNHEKALRFTGEILVDLIPKIMDTEQEIQIEGIDGKAETVMINGMEKDALGQVVKDKQTGKEIFVNSLSQGRYAVSIETGPAFSTQRDESAQQLIELSNGSDLFAEITPDLIAKNLNLVDGDEFVKRARKVMIQKGIADPTDEEIQELGLDQQQQPDPQAIALTDNVNAQTRKLEVDTQLQDAKTQETLVKTQSETVSAYNELLTTLQKQLDMGIPLSEAQRTLVVTQGDIVAESQAMIRDDEPNSEQAADIAAMIQGGQIPQV